MTPTAQLVSPTADPAPLADIRALICGVRGETTALAGRDECLPAELRSALTALVEGGVASAETGALTTSFAAFDGALVRLLLVGLGDLDDAEQVREAFGAAIDAVPAGEGVAVLVPDEAADMQRAAVEGVLLGDYTVAAQHSEAPSPKSRTVSVLAPQHDTTLRACIAQASVIAQAVAIARDLGNAAPSDLTPETFAQRVRTEGGELGLTVTVLDDVQLHDAGCGGILGVGRGSANPPRLVRVAHDPADARMHIALVGKGITFDSGGLGIKDRAGMLWMKCDMGGAAAVYAAIVAISALKLPIRVTGWLALAENMPSGTATKPGDVLRMRNGKTVEITDTDAEGRLVLADGLACAAEEDPDLLVDVATLTGAQIIALGQRTSAVMARRDSASDMVLAAADASGESMWRLPMPQHLRAHLRSSVADLANMGGKDGGVIVAAHFLEEFVPQGTPWAHVDIAGPAINTEERHGYTPHGATGAGVRMLVQLAMDAADAG